MKIYTSSLSPILIDPEDYDILIKHKWYETKRNGETVGIACNGKIRPISHLILNVPKGKVVDHIDGNVFDNRRKNLRITTQQNNCKNKRLYKNNKSGYKGVLWAKDKKKWRAVIVFNKKRIHLGYYKDIKDASDIYEKMSSRLFKQFKRQ